MIRARLCGILALSFLVCAPAAAAELPFELHGFWEAGAGSRVQDDPYEDDMTLLETRLQLDSSGEIGAAAWRIRPDFLYDDVAETQDIDLETGTGWIDLREANIAASPAEALDVKAGRQTLTWGTGDLVFINDLFPKDWNSFFIGRDDEYLKVPSDALKASLFSDAGSLDIVYTPRFDADRFIDGTRISYWSDPMGSLAGQNAVVQAQRPDEWFSDDEVAVRAYRTIGEYEAALYGYRGFWKSPGGMDPATGQAVFPALSVYGASLRGNVLKGIGYAEAGWYDSGDDGNGTDPFVKNSEFRVLAGYEQEIGRDFTAAIQYYLEHMLQYGDYRDTLPPGVNARDEDRQVATLRLTKLAMSQNLTLSLFTFYSPTDRDAYVRPKARYRFSDSWTGEVGANIFTGEEPYTFFGQFEDSSNIYASARCSF